MEAFRKQASKLREQVSKQQQAVIKQFSGTGYESSSVMVIDEVELLRHQQLEKLYRSTRAGKDFQKDIVRAGEALTAVGYKKIEIGNKLSEDCCKYGSENIHDNVLVKAASFYGDARIHIKKEQEDLDKLLTTQGEKLIGTVFGACSPRHGIQRRPVQFKSQEPVSTHGLPWQLCDNAGFDAIDALNKLRQKHALASVGLVVPN